MKMLCDDDRDDDNDEDERGALPEMDVEVMGDVSGSLDGMVDPFPVPADAAPPPPPFRLPPISMRC